MCLLECNGVERLRAYSLAGADKLVALLDCVYGPMLPDEHPGQFRLFSATAEQVSIHRIIRPEGRWTVDEWWRLFFMGKIIWLASYPKSGNTWMRALPQLPARR